MREYTFFVYIMASHRNGTIYIGITNDLIRRVDEHKKGFVKGFTKDYKVKDLVYYEETDSVEAAIIREKQLKNWHRKWKKDLIEIKNPYWRDLFDDIIK
ncbi:MAG: hypothetical protein A2452_09720 [Candidatus Firestonebacteria bacterium RIFOXYC2_FULL_39_67]|nr:MAG: hypothetical protein A2536_04050 [Candidatus Firestonebacteria bacterium RIFOXYD2_FULL_39_29]OGF51859.1 MAG: hypothetical protein A2497_00765 [Candidatus Firestonebacteria bacterium RifOxyC12_full_39_7]OGF54640.1 MAG: hypothetical protein A2452_09720 [Candidatus Firestonebacteria bacterium RIFOXYC2_FULL_39_67]